TCRAAGLAIHFIFNSTIKLSKLFNFYTFNININVKFISYLQYLHLAHFVPLLSVILSKCDHTKRLSLLSLLLSFSFSENSVSSSPSVSSSLSVSSFPSDSSFPSASSSPFSFSLSLSFSFSSTLSSSFPSLHFLLTFSLHFLLHNVYFLN